MTTTIELSDTQMNLIVIGLRDLVESYKESAKNFRTMAKNMRDGVDYPLFAEGEAGASAATALADSFATDAANTVALYELLSEWQYDHTTLSLTYED